MRNLNIDTVQSHITSWLLNYITKSEMKAFVVGVSGGIDSALTSALCASTGIRTIVVSLPIRQEAKQLARANKHIEWLKMNFSNVESIEVDLTIVFNNFEKLFTDNFSSDLAFANSRSRLRMTALYQVAGSVSGLVVGTGNKVEDFGVGFYTKYGDGGVDISPIADLLKSEVKILAEGIGIIQEIIVAKPTDGLWGDDRTDEDQIGATYDELEWAMNYCENSNPFNQSSLSIRQTEVLNLYRDLNLRNQHKMKPIPICIINKE